MESVNQRIGNVPDSRYQELRRYDINQPVQPELLNVRDPVPEGEDDFLSNSSSSTEYSAESCSSCSGSSSRFVVSFLCHSSKLLSHISSNRSYILEWESHIDSNGELYYVEFSSNQHLTNIRDTTKEKEITEKEREKILKKKKKSKHDLHVIKWIGSRLNQDVVISGRLSRLLKQRKELQNPRLVPPCESPAYLLTDTFQSPVDDWSDWTSFNIELEVHPTLEGSTR